METRSARGRHAAAALRRALRLGAGPWLALLLVPPLPAVAAFHLWEINELYTSPDGSVQFVELFTTFASQQFTLDHQIIASQTGQPNRVFTFPSNTPSPTTNRHLLIASAGYASLPGCPAPDFLLPTPFLYGPIGSVDFVNADVVSYTALPADGIQSLAGDGATTATNSPTNYAGSSCTLDLSEPGPIPALSPGALLLLCALLAAAAHRSLRAAPPALPA